MFYERDRVGEFTLLEGDIVNFKVATDKRTKYKRAVEVIFMEHSLMNNNNNNNHKEKREYGVIEKVFDNHKYGAIRSIEREDLAYFQINEFICLNKTTAQQQHKYFDTGDCVEFTVVEYRVSERIILV